MQQTTNYQLNKPEASDYADIAPISENMDTIDAQLKTAQNHREDGGVHVTGTDKQNWNSKAPGSLSQTVSQLAQDIEDLQDAVSGGGVDLGGLRDDLDSLESTVSGHTGNSSIHVTSSDKSNWNSKAPGSLSTTVSNHTGNSDIHVTSTDKEKWDGYSTIHTLSYYKSGVTHYLTGLSGLSGTVSCVFKATANFNAGDTIRIDSTAYTIQLSNGEAAEDNLFVSGATVAVIVDKGNYRVNFKAAGGVKLPAGSIVIVNRFTANGQFTVPATGTYRITAIGPGGDGGNSYYNSSNGYRNSGGGGGSGGVAVLTAALSKGEVYPVTVSTAQCSFGSLISATTGKAGDYTPGGAGGTAAGGDTNFSGNYGENGKAEMNAVSGGGGAGYTEEQIATVPALSFTGGAGGDETPSDGADVPGAGWSSAGLGGGGAGCDRSARSGGTGGNGAVIIELVLE